MPKPVEPKFGRHWPSSSAKKRIETATDGAQHEFSVHLSIDDRIPKRGEPLTLQMLEGAKVRLGYRNHDEPEKLFAAVVAYAASYPEIHAGWAEVATIVEYHGDSMWTYAGSETWKTGEYMATRAGRSFALWRHMPGWEGYVRCGSAKTLAQATAKIREWKSRQAKESAHV